MFVTAASEPEGRVGRCAEGGVLSCRCRATLTVGWKLPVLREPQSGGDTPALGEPQSGGD